MTKEEAIEHIRLMRLNAAISDAKSFREALDIAIDALSQPSLPSNLDEAAEEYFEQYNYMPKGFVVDAFKACAEWMAGQGVTKEAVIGMATEEISINVSQQTLNELDLCPGDKVVVQIRKK